MNKRLVSIVFLILLGQFFTVLPVKSDSNEASPFAVVGRYILHQDSVWFAYNKTVQQLRDEGYDVAGDASLLLYVKYMRLNYSLKCKIVSLSWPNVTLQNIEGTYDLNMTACRIMEDNSIGEKVASQIRPNQPEKMGLAWDSYDPYLGVMMNPSALIVGNSFSIESQQFNVVGKETLTNTPWGQNETFLLGGIFANATHSYIHSVWCDAQSGIVLKEIIDSKTPWFTQHEELRFVETSVKFEIASDGAVHETPVQTNSTINSFNFDSSTNKIDVKVSGSTGTLGTFQISIPKVIVPQDHSIEVYVDNQKKDYRLTEDVDNYYLRIEYLHSTHVITISFVPHPIWIKWWFWTIIVAGIIGSTVAIYLLKRKKRFS